MTNFVRVVPYEVGFYIDGDPPLASLHAVRHDGLEFRAAQDGADLEEFHEKLPWFHTIIRALDLRFTPGRGYHVDDGILKALVRDGETPLEAVHRVLGRGVERRGVIWFPGRARVVVDYDTVTLCEWLLVQAPLMRLTEQGEALVKRLLERGVEHNWLIPWSPSNREGVMFQVAHRDAVIRVDASVEDLFGHLGSGGCETDFTGGLEGMISSFSTAYRRAMFDREANVTTMLFHVGPRKRGRRVGKRAVFVAPAPGLDVSPDAEPPGKGHGLCWGWQPSEGVIEGLPYDEMAHKMRKGAAIVDAGQWRAERII